MKATEFDKTFDASEDASEDVSDAIYWSQARERGFSGLGCR